MNALALIQAATEPVTSGVTWDDVVHAIPTKEQYAVKIRSRNGVVKLPVMYSYGTDRPQQGNRHSAAILIIGKRCHAKILDNTRSARVEFRRGPLSEPGPSPILIGQPQYFEYEDYRNAKELLTAVLAEFVKRTGTGKKATAAAEPADDVFQHAVSSLQPLTGSKFYIIDGRNGAWWLSRALLVGSGHMTVEFAQHYGPDVEPSRITYSATTYAYHDRVELEISSPADACRGRNTPRKHGKRCPMPGTGTALVKILLNHIAADMHATAIYRNGKVQHLPVTAAAEPAGHVDIDALIREFFNSLRKFSVRAQGRTVVVTDDDLRMFKASALVSETGNEYSIYPHYQMREASKYGGVVIEQVRDEAGKFVHSNPPKLVVNNIRDRRDLVTQIVQRVLELDSGHAAHGAAEPTPVPESAIMTAFCTLVKSARQPKSVKAHGMDITLHADFHGLPTLPNHADLNLDFPGGRYTLRAYGFDSNSAAFLAVAKRDAAGTGWESIRYAKQFMYAKSATDLLTQVLTFIVHVEKQNS